MAIQAGAIAIAQWEFDITSRLWLNVVNICALGVGMSFRFWTYSRWIWLLTPAPRPPASDDQRDEPAFAQQ